MPGGGAVIGGATTVRSLQAKDLAFAANLHTQALPQGFFVLLGHRYLRAYYRGFSASPFAVALVAERAGEPIGVLVGTTDSVAHHRYVVRHHGWRLALHGAAGLVLRRQAAQHFLRSRALRYAKSIARAWRPRPAGSNRPRPAAIKEGPVGVLSHVAVVPSARGLGAGTAMAERFVAAARDAGTARLELVTLTGPEGAGPLYERLGWQRVGQHARDGLQYARFALELT
ncbi:MAG: GNAT family N-acetyltransferase [Actinomycetota bacterium]|nr:GNAT family N-acetyltransferase [Actinomycetota bacterium]MDQ3575716.1 GNAT family N-acetyltransferase [Actinomycetota bacterium]